MSLKILVVDDNADAVESLALFLEMLGHDVRMANDGFEALEVAEAFHPDLGLLDIGLPTLDGHEVAVRLRRRPWARQISLVAVSGWGLDSDRERSRQAGFNDHLVKPVDPHRLTQLLDGVVASKQPPPRAG